MNKPLPTSSQVCFYSVILYITILPFIRHTEQRKTKEVKTTAVLRVRTANKCPTVSLPNRSGGQEDQNQTEEVREYSPLKSKSQTALVILGEKTHDS